MFCGDQTILSCAYFNDMFLSLTELISQNIKGFNSKRLLKKQNVRASSLLKLALLPIILLDPLIAHSNDET